MPPLTELNKSTHYSFFIYSTIITDIYMKYAKNYVYTLYKNTLWYWGGVDYLLSSYFYIPKWYHEWLSLFHILFIQIPVIFFLKKPYFVEQLQGLSFFLSWKK